MSDSVPARDPVRRPAVSYSLYRDAARTLVWGVNDGADAVAGNG